MLGFKASAVLLAVATGAVSSVLADSPNWSLRELNPDNYLDFPGRVMLLETTPLVEGSLDDCVDFCESFDNCIAFVYGE